MRRVGTAVLGGILAGAMLAPQAGGQAGAKSEARVVSARVFAMTFPAGARYLRKEADGVTAKAENGIMYRLPLPDFVVAASVRRAWLVYPSAEAVTVTLNGSAAERQTCGAAVLAAVRACPQAVAYTTAVTQREIAVEIRKKPGEGIREAEPGGEAASAARNPTLVVETVKRMGKAAGWHTDDLSATTEMPQVRTLFDYVLRDTSLRPGGDAMYYLTGSTGAPDMWAVTGDIQLWKSADLRSWTPVVTRPRARSVVWNIDRDGSWQRTITLRDGAPFRPMWAPEIHFLKGTYWIPYSIPRLGTGLLKSSTGRPEGPYVSALEVDAPLTGGIDASLFEDEDGSVYFLWAGGMIARMKPDMSGLAEPGRQLRPANAPMVGFEGSSLFRYKGRYYLSAADFTNGDYNCFTASAESLYGPYSDRYISVPHGGHNNFFQDAKGNWWSTFFGNDPHAPVKERPAIVPMHFDEHGELKPLGRRP